MLIETILEKILLVAFDLFSFLYILFLKHYYSVKLYIYNLPDFNYMFILCMQILTRTLSLIFYARRSNDRGILFCPVCLFVCLSVCLMSILTFAITFEQKETEISFDMYTQIMMPYQMT